MHCAVDVHARRSGHHADWAMVPLPFCSHAPMYPPTDLRADRSCSCATPTQPHPPDRNPNVHICRSEEHQFLLARQLLYFHLRVALSRMAEVIVQHVRSCCRLCRLFFSANKCLLQETPKRQKLSAIPVRERVAFGEPSPYATGPDIVS